MRLFSEKVEPTFTSSNLNIIMVEDFQEVFFDVFEFEINGKKFVAEKVSEYKESPVVNIPLVLEGKKFTAPFILQRGRFEILFNKDNCVFVEDVAKETQSIVIEGTEKQAEVETIIFEKKEDILKEIAQARRSAEKYVESLKQQKINEAAQYLDEKKNAFNEEISKSKKELLDEFLTIVNSVKGEFFEFNEKEKEKLSFFIESSISELADQLVESIEVKQDVAEKRFNEQLNELATNILSGVLLKEISANNDKSVKDINERFIFIADNLKILLRSERDQIDDSVNNKLREFNNSIVNLEKTNVELNDLINKGDNRALSRIGNVKSQLEEAIDLNTTTLVARVNEAEDKIRTFYDNKISLIEEKVEDLSADNKQYFLNLINESKQSLLNEIANIKVDVPNIVIEKSNGKQEVDLKGIKSELEKIIGTRFSNELQALKRLIEMSSGGGSVAKQFAAGGTMEGTLNVTGQYLSAGVDLLTIFAGGGDDIEVNTVVRSSSANWNNAYNTGTVYQVNSASYATIGFTNSKFFPLSGGTITGATVINNNLTVNGNLTATGTTTFNNTVFSVTSALSVVHVGEGPAVWVGNSGLGDIASFYDIDQNLEVLHIGGNNGSFPNVGVKTSTPNKTFTVAGEISSTSDITTSGKIYIQGNGGSDQWQETYTTMQSNSANWQTSYSLVSASNLVYTTDNQTIAGNKTFTNDVVINGQATAPNQTASSDSSLINRSLLRTKLTDPDTENRIDYTHWFGIQGLGFFTGVGNTPGTIFVPVGGNGFGAGVSIATSTRIGSGAGGAGLRLGTNNYTGGNPLTLNTAGAFTLKARAFKAFQTTNAAFGFILAGASNTAMWSANSIGIYYVPTPVASWPALSVVTAGSLNTTINVNGIVFAVSAAGTTGSSQPVWNMTIDAATVDGTVTWRNLGPHTNNNWAVATGSTNATSITGTLSSFRFGWNGNTRDVVLTINYSGDTSSPYDFNFTVQNATTAVSVNNYQVTSNLSITPQFFARPDSNPSSLGSDVIGVKYFSYSGTINSSLN